MQPLGLLLGPLDSQDVWLEILRMGTKVECVGSQGPLGSKTYCLILTSLEGGEALPGEVPPPSALLTEA